MSHNKTLQFSLFALFLLSPLVIASPALAAPMIPAGTTSQILSPERAQLSSELSQLSQELQSASTSSSAPFTFSQGQSLQLGSSYASNGHLIITLTHFLHSNPDPTIPPILQQPAIQYAQITLNYQPCAAAAPAVCVGVASSSYPILTSIMYPGQSTGYLHYQIALQSLSSSTATFEITDTSYLSEIQSALQTLATQVYALIGTRN